MINIEVFGPGCARCQATKEAIRQAIEAAGVEATLSHISDPKEIAKSRVFFTPAVRIDGEICPADPVRLEDHGGPPGCRGHRKLPQTHLDGLKSRP
ncbi:MAG: thioredoxin family protein [candidate division NC10 bacterium]